MVSGSGDSSATKNDQLAAEGIGGFLGSMVQLGYPIENLAAIGTLALLSQLPEQDLLVVALVAIPVFGWLSDRIGRKTMFLRKLRVRDSFRLPDVLASKQEGSADHHVDDCRGHYLWTNCRI
jgi:hypothetical protein